MFGILIGAIFFGKPDIMFLIGIGSAIPDLDREYGFLSAKSFRDHQVHRAFCHNFLFMGLLYLVNPFLALGAFLHTLLDALTTAKDRGVEWLYPFTRFVKKALYDQQGKSVPKDPAEKIYFYQYDPIALTRKSAEDLKEYKPAPWRRTYGPALSGGALDLAVFTGSAAIVLMLLVLSEIGVREFIDVTIRPFNVPFDLPLIIGAVGIVIALGVGEVDRKREERNLDRPSKLYKALFSLAVAIMLFSVALGAYFNPVIVATVEGGLAFVAIGSIISLSAATFVIKLYTSGFMDKHFKRKKEKKEPSNGEVEEGRRTEDADIAII